MKGYNDYISMTRRYLKSYNQFLVTVENLKEEIKAQEHALSQYLDVSAGISKYGGEPGGGTPELNNIESAAARHEAITARINQMKMDVESVERKIRQVDKAIDGLHGDDRRLIEGYYKDQLSWKELSIELFMTEKWARERANKAIREMAVMIFGSVAMPEQQQLFIFAV